MTSERGSEQESLKGRSEAQPIFLAPQRDRSETDLRLDPLSIGQRSSFGIHCEGFTVASIAQNPWSISKVPDGHEHHGRDLVQTAMCPRRHS